MVILLFIRTDAQEVLNISQKLNKGLHEKLIDIEGWIRIFNNTGQQLFRCHTSLFNRRQLITFLQCSPHNQNEFLHFHIRLADTVFVDGFEDIGNTFKGFCGLNGVLF